MFSKQLYSLSLFLCFELCFGDTVDVNTTSGVVRGQTLHVLKTSINQFLSIPFAQPPTGGLRFAKPKPIEKPLNGIIDGTKIGNSCIQGIPYLLPNMSQSEDCLFLNIWSPESDDQNSTQLKPVMFWIYGGGFVVGSCFEEAYNGSALASKGVVLVSFNYRLGHFGFLYGADETAPGNVGLYDQLLALKWVRENIHLFGGDKDQITIFGESAGSLSVSAHILSPLSRGLFKRAIAESGSLYRNKRRGYYTKSESLLLTKQLSKSLNCSDSKEWLECLRRVDANVINKYPSYPKADFPIPTLIDEGTDFLPMSAQKAYKDNAYNRDIDLMAGVTRDEGSRPRMENITEQQFQEMVNQTNSYFYDLNVEKITEFYLRNRSTGALDAFKWAFFDYFGDILIKCSTYLFAKQYAKHTPDKGVYVYELTYMTKTFMEKMGCSEDDTGICHSADLDLVFGQPWLKPNLYSIEDKTISEDMMKMWTNFAKTGKPNNDWPKLNPNSVTKVKDLNPFKTNHYLNDPFINCDTFWDKYFN